MKHPLFPGPTPAKRMAVSDPTVYRVEPTQTMSERGQVVSIVVAPSGRQVGVITLPLEDVISARESAA